MSTTVFPPLPPALLSEVSPPTDPGVIAGARQGAAVIVTVVEVSYVCRFTHVADVQMLIVDGSSKKRVCWNLRVVCVTRVCQVSINEKIANADTTCQRRVCSSCEVKEAASENISAGAEWVKASESFAVQQKSIAERVGLVPRDPFVAGVSDRNRSEKMEASDNRLCQKSCSRRTLAEVHSPVKNEWKIRSDTNRRQKRNAAVVCSSSLACLLKGVADRGQHA